MFSDGHFFASIMASGRKRFRFTVDVALTAFKDRLPSVRDLLSPPGEPKLDNLTLPCGGLESAQTGSFYPTQVRR